MSGDKDDIHLDDDDPMPGNWIVPPQQPKQHGQPKPQGQPGQQAPQPQAQQAHKPQQAPQPQLGPDGQPKKKKYDRRVDLYFSEKDFLFIREFSTERNQGFGKTVLQAIELLRTTTEKEKAFAERKKQLEATQNENGG